MYICVYIYIYKQQISHARTRNFCFQIFLPDPHKPNIGIRKGNTSLRFFLLSVGTHVLYTLRRITEKFHAQELTDDEQ